MAVAIGLAFADSSIVVLALPEIYGRFGVSIVDVSWVITAYNLAVVAAAAVLLLWVRPSPRTLTALGLTVFAVASVVCGTATSFGVLVGARVAQGGGAACLLVGSLLLLRVITGSAARARSTWSFAAAVGVAIGPGLGGALTQLLSWRSIFLVQAPVALLALAGVVPARDQAEPDTRGGVDLRALVADLAFVLLFAALVGALFLSVLLFVVVWGYGPLQGAVIVSVLAVGTVAVGPVGRSLPSWLAALTGGWMLTGGLLGLAWLPAASGVYAAAALAFCGCGFGLLNSVLGRSSFPGPERPLGAGIQVERLRRPATLEIGAKHVGIVLGLLATAPMLATDLDAATRDATLAATAIVLDAPLELRVKVPLALDLQQLVEETPRGEVPDVRAPFEERGADDKPEVAAVRDELSDAIEATITRSFRPSFVAAALFAAAAAMVAVAATLFRPRR